jgi:hypothetical protein
MDIFNVLTNDTGRRVKPPLLPRTSCYAECTQPANRLDQFYPRCCSLRAVVGETSCPTIANLPRSIFSCRYSNRLRAGVGVHLSRLSVPEDALGCTQPKKFYAHLALATGQGNVDETAGVFEALQSAALGNLGLLLGLNL